MEKKTQNVNSRKSVLKSNLLREKLTKETVSVGNKYYRKILLTENRLKEQSAGGKS